MNPEQLKFLAESGDIEAQYYYNQYLIERGEINLDYLEHQVRQAHEVYNRYNNYASIPILIYILEQAININFKDAALNCLLELNAIEAGPAILQELHKIEPRGSSSTYRDRLIMGLAKFNVTEAIPEINGILIDSVETDDARSTAALAMVSLDREQAIETIKIIWEHATTVLRWGLIRAIRVSESEEFIELLVSALGTPPGSAIGYTQMTAVSALCDLLLKKTDYFGLDSRPSAKALYQLNQPFSIESKVIKAIKKQYPKVRNILDLFMRNAKHNPILLLVAARIIRRFPQHLRYFRPQILTLIKIEKNLDWRTELATRAVRITLTEKI